MNTEWTQHDDFQYREFRSGENKFEQFINEFPDYWELEQLLVVGESFDITRKQSFSTLDEALKIADEWKRSV